MSIDAITAVLQRNYGITGELIPLVGYSNTNFRLTTSDNKNLVVKIQNAEAKEIEIVAAQLQVLNDLHKNWRKAPLPEPVRSKNGRFLEVFDDGGESGIIWILSWIEGKLLKDSAPDISMLEQLGSLLGKMDVILQELDSSVIRSRVWAWDLQHALMSKGFMEKIDNPEIRRIVHYFYEYFELNVLPHLHELRHGLIHSDVNDYNVIVRENKVEGLIDFGDLVYSPVINELAIALTYILLQQNDIEGGARALVSEYNKSFPLQEKELDLLYFLIGTRIAVSLSVSAHSKDVDPSNEYLFVSEKPLMNFAARWIEINPIHFLRSLRDACLVEETKQSSTTDKLDHRMRFVNPSLSISYEDPIQMSSAAFQYMYSSEGRTYLDCVNNICHVGHCHPRVVEAGVKQMEKLNTNTRYVYDSLNEYAEMLIHLLPDPLNTVYFLNSGSEAGDLAQRIARTVSGSDHTIVIDHGYHGNTIAGIQASPYKFQGPGGMGKMNHIHVLEIPDMYRGKYADYEDPVNEYIKELENILNSIDEKGLSPGVFYGESIMGCGGQVMLPPGYLKKVYEKVREKGGLCIADEVQTGFGRVGEKFWGFELHDVVPDLVVLGKPMGNGHPLSAVVTTREIANAFDNGMEFFSSFGGNPVSCEIGKAVLEVISGEDLQNHASAAGQYFKDKLQHLLGKHPIVGDVRGSGLFLGIEFVEDRETKIPLTSGTKAIIEEMKKRGVLLSSDGPFNNVIKIKPPLPFNNRNTDFVVDHLNQAIAEGSFLN